MSSPGAIASWHLGDVDVVGAEPGLGVGERRAGGGRRRLLLERVRVARGRRRGPDAHAWPVVVGDHVGAAQHDRRGAVAERAAHQQRERVGDRARGLDLLGGDLAPVLGVRVARAVGVVLDRHADEVLLGQLAGVDALAQPHRVDRGELQPEAADDLDVRRASRARPATGRGRRRTSSRSRPRARCRRRRRGSPAPPRGRRSSRSAQAFSMLTIGTRSMPTSRSTDWPRICSWPCSTPAIPLEE